MSLINEHLLRPKFSRTLASVTVLITMIFSEYGIELLQIQHYSTFLLQRIRPTIYIIISNHILLPYPSKIYSIISTIGVITLEIYISLHHRSQVCDNIPMTIKLTVTEFITYIYAAIFGIYMSYLLETIIRRAFRNQQELIESKFNIYREKEQQEQLLSSCFPQHLIDDVRKDLKEMIRVLDRQGEIQPRPFKKLYVEMYDNVSILYADIVNSMLMTNNLTPKDLVETLNDMFGRFDECAENNHCLRIKLLGDCYYCVSGLPEFNNDHALNCVQMGLDIIDIIKLALKIFLCAQFFF